MAVVIRTRNNQPASGINDYILIVADNKLLCRLHVVIRETTRAYAELMYSFCFVSVSLECALNAYVRPFTYLIYLLACVSHNAS